MAIELTSLLEDAAEMMEISVEHLDETLSHIRAGKANVKILDSVKVDYYGTLSPLSNVATLSTPDGRTIVVQPWDKKMLHNIEKAILDSDVGITPDNNGELIRLCIPQLTEERRKKLLKQSKQEMESAKVAIRNARRDCIEQLKKAEKEGLSEDLRKDAEADVQDVHDKYIKKLETLLQAKEKEIMTI